MSPIRVLVADDHASFRKVITDFLARQPDIELVGPRRLIHPPPHVALGLRHAEPRPRR